MLIVKTIHGQSLLKIHFNQNKFKQQMLLIPIIEQLIFIYFIRSMEYKEELITRFSPLAMKGIISRKYDTTFNFYSAKHINNIVYNKQTDTNLNFKDILTLIEDTEYLKRYYCTVNKQKKEEIKDRMKLLKNFYQSSELLTYEYPMMVINEKEKIFLNRHKKLNKIVNQSEQQQQQSSNLSKLNGSLKFEPNSRNESVIVDLSWSDIIYGKFQEQNQIEEVKQSKYQIQYDQEYQIFESESDVRRQQFLIKIGHFESEHTNKISFINSVEEQQINHLILDFDDLDKENVIHNFNKLVIRQNKTNQNQSYKSNNNLTSINSLLNNKKPLSTSILTTAQQSEIKKQQSNHKTKNYTKQSMLLGSREQRQQQMKLMKKSSQIQTKKPKGLQLYQKFMQQQQKRRKTHLFKNNTNKLTKRYSQQNFNEKQLKINILLENNHQDFIEHTQSINQIQFQPIQQEEQFNLEELRKQLKKIKQTPIIYQTSPKILSKFSFSTQLESNQLVKVESLPQPNSLAQLKLNFKKKSKQKGLTRVKSQQHLTQSNQIKYFQRQSRWQND